MVTGLCVVWLLASGEAADPAVTNAPTPNEVIPVGPWQWPVPATGINSLYGERRDPMHGKARKHHGIDLDVAYGQTIAVAKPGVVAFAGRRRGHGRTVVVTHDDGYVTKYAHLAQIWVRTGDILKAAKSIGRAGTSGRSTGPHLHFEVWKDGKPVDPLGVLRPE